MFNHKEVLVLFRDVLAEVDGFPMDQVQWENTKFKPPPPIPASVWIKESYLPGEEVRGANRILDLTGVVQYDIFVAAGSSTEAADLLALAIRNSFKPSLKLGGFLTVVRAERLPGNPDGPWWQLPIRITFRAHKNLN